MSLWNTQLRILLLNQVLCSHRLSIYNGKTTDRYPRRHTHRTSQARRAQIQGQEGSAGGVSRDLGNSPQQAHPSKRQVPLSGQRLQRVLERNWGLQPN